MKTLIIGGNGTIGRKVSERLSEKYTVLVAGRNSGNIPVPMYKIVDGYIKCIERKITGQIIRIMA